MNLKDCIDIDNYGGVYPFVRTDKAEIELMQYTGLKDRLGVDIYEGDIVREELRSGAVNRYAIEYYKNGFYLSDFLHGNWDAEDTEVIGNIYQNPELLAPKH